MHLKKLYDQIDYIKSIGNREDIREWRNKSFAELNRVERLFDAVEAFLKHGQPEYLEYMRSVFELVSGKINPKEVIHGLDNRKTEL